MDEDIFDVLDVSLREDTYTSLLCAVFKEYFNEYPGIAREILGELSGQAVLAYKPAVFRGGMGERRSQDHPDIVFALDTDKGPWRVVIEAKLKSGESGDQCIRYRENCEADKASGQIAGYSLFFMPISNYFPNDAVWPVKTHVEMVELLQRHDVNDQLSRHPVLGPLWTAYLRRLKHYTEGHQPSDHDRILAWLQDSKWFITGDERCMSLARAVGGDGWTTSGTVYRAAGRQQYLLFFYQLSWTTPRYVRGKSPPLEECFDVHLELCIPSGFESGEVTCHLHCETSPYMTGTQLVQLGDEADGFKAFAERFAGAIHRSLAGTAWREANRALEKAKLTCPLSATTTVAELRSFLLPQMDTLKAKVTAAIEDARGPGSRNSGRP